MKYAFAGSHALRVVHVVVVVFIFAASLATFGQTATNVQVTNTVIQPSVTRLGVNLGDQDYWDSGQILKNLVWRNPGFEGLRFRSILKCTSPTVNTCMDDNQYSGQPTGFWKGGTYLILSGASAGKTGTVAASTKNPSSCSGCGQIIQFDQSINAAFGDYFVVTNYFPGGGDSGWWDSTSGGGTISTELNDISPNSPGKQALLLSASGSGQSAGVTQYFDTFTGISFIQMTGAFQLTFRAKGVGGNNQLSVNAQRLQAGTSGPWLNKTLTLTNAWQDYTMTFTANEAGSGLGNIQLAFSAAGGNVELDDVALVQTDSSSSNPTVFRDDVVNALKALNPGTIRMMAAGAALGSDLPNQLAVPFARYRGGFNSSATNEPDVAYGIHEFLQLCQTVGADPWITIPTATTPQEMTEFINYLTGNGGDTYSALRIARGQAEPWTTVFNKIHIELGNETWNGDFKGESISYPAYPQWANQVFGAARAVSTYDGTKFDLVLDGWASVPGYNSAMLTYSTQHDSIDIAPYLLYSANNEAQSTMFGALMAEPEMFDTAGGQVYNDVLAAQGAARKTAVNVYETNMGSMIGNITQTQLDQLTPSVGAGIATADHMLQMMRLGVQAQNAFALPQYKFLRSDQSLARLWGIVIDMGTTNRRRPQFLTQALANSVIGGTMMQTVHTGANPTWNQPLSSDSVQLNGAHYLQSFAFSNNGATSVILFNLSQTTAMPVTFSGPNAPSGSVQMSQITSANITDNNETANTVQTVTKTLGGFDPTVSFSLPPFSMTVLTANSSVTQAPTFSVAAGTYTSAQTVALSDGTLGAKIYYTTDGSTPTTASTQYTGPITVSASETVNAIATASGLTASAVASAAYVISAQTAAATPVFSVAGGSYTTAQTVAITDATAGATIYFTTDGSAPTTNSSKYAGPVTVSVTQTLSAIATAANHTNSAVAVANYTITTAKQTATPVFSVAAGNYSLAQTVAISDATPGAIIYYTTNGSVPTTSSVKYVGPIAVSTNATLSAIATATNYTTSAVAKATYTISPVTPVVAQPVFSVPSGTYTATQKVAITAATAGATIFYTTDGSTPTASSISYQGAITVSKTAVVKAIATKPLFSPSPVVSADYTIETSTESPTSSPTFSVKAGSYPTAQTITLSDSMPGAEIFYTINGVTPTTGSTKYAVPIKISTSTVLKAIAVAPSHADSGETVALYIIGPSLTPATFSTGEMVLRGTSKLVGTTLQLTDGGEAEIAAAWSAKKAPVNTFNLEFTFKLPKSAADGFTLTFQNSSKGNWASGGNGSALGYQGISNSVAIKFDLYDIGKAASETGLLINGVAPSTSSIDLSKSGINLHDGHTYMARFDYDGTQLIETVVDTTTQAVFTHTYKVNIAGVLGSSTAYVGFTGSTGNSTSTQQILNWAYVGK